MLIGILIATTIGFTAAAEAKTRVNGKIAFISERDGNPEVYVMNADGSEQTRLTNNKSNDQDPYWSPRALS